LTDWGKPATALRLPGVPIFLISVGLLLDPKVMVEPETLRLDSESDGLVVGP